MSAVRYLRLYALPGVLLFPVLLGLIMAMEAGETGFSLKLRLLETAYLYGGLALVVASYARWPEDAAEVLRSAGARPSLLAAELGLHLGWTLLMALPPILAYRELRTLPELPWLLAALVLSGGLFLLAVRVLWWPTGAALAVVLPFSLFVVLELLSFQNPTLCPLAPALLSKECPRSLWGANLVLRGSLLAAAYLVAYPLRARWWP